MKKRVLLSVFCALFAFTAYGYSFKSGDLYYNITSSTNMTVEVTYGKDKYVDAVYSIPIQVTNEGKTYYVTGIGSSAFSGCTALTTITFDEGTYVKTIKDHAFSGCNAMSRITIPESVTSIGNYAFSGCLTLKFVTIEDATTTLSLGYGSMNGSNYGLFADADLRSFYWGRPLQYDSNYGRSPIANQSKLSEITIGPNVTSISPYMFSGNGALSTVELPATVTSLDDHAFHGFAGMKSFTIPRQITAISKYAFADCTGLTSLTIPEWVTEIGAGAFSGCTGFKSFVIPNNVMSIGNYAFNGCTSMTGVTFEEGDETLSLGYNNYHYYSSDPEGRGMFFDCPLISTFIGRNLSYKTEKDYGYSPFANHKTLTKVHFGNPVKTIPSYLLAGCKNLTTFEYNRNCAPTIVEDYAFWGCKSITWAALSLPESVNSINVGAFKDCEGLTSIVIKPSVTKIGNYAFNGCTSITGVTFEEGDETLSLGYNNYHYYSSDPEGRGMFFDCPLISTFIGRNLSYKTDKDYGYSPFANNKTLTKVHFGNPVETIQSYLAAGCKNLTTLQYNKNCAPTSIESYAFWGCASLTENDIVYPKSVKTLGDGAFRDCTSLEGYTIPDHITTVGNSVFMNCEKMASVVVKPSVKSIGNYAFNGCTSMTGVTFEEGDETLSLGYNNYHYYSSDPEGRGMFFDCPLISTFIGRNLSYKTDKDYGYSPFANNKTLTKVHFGNPVKTIPSYLVAGCKNLTTFQYNKNCAPTVVEDYAFWGCKSITWSALSLPKSVNSINVGAFKDCEGLTSIVIKPSVTKIGNYAFNGCTSITGVTFEEGDELLTLGYNNYHYYSSDPEGKGMFYDCPLISTFIGRNLSYKTDKDYGYSPFAKNETLTKVHFGNPVKAIQSYLLTGCKNLTTFQYNKNCAPTVVEDYAFWGCKSITWTALSLPKSVNSINVGAFKDCEGLTSIVIKSSVTKIGNFAFNGCTSIKDVVFEEGDKLLTLGYNNYHYYSSDPEGKGMFYDCPLISTFIGRNLSYKTDKNYGYSPFAKNETLTKVHLGNSVETIQSYLVTGCKNLTIVEYDKNFAPTIVEDYAFSGCTGLTSLTVPNSVTSIKGNAFGNCANLKDFYCLAENVPTTRTDAFSGTSIEKTTLHVPADCADAYQAVAPWNGFKKIVEMERPISLNKYKATIEKGKTLTLKATVNPSDLTDKSVTWESSNTAVATVSSSGKVKGVKAGTATITCTANATGAEATCEVTVGYVKLDQTEAFVEKDKTLTLKATVYPSSLEDKSVTWKSSNKDVATVSSSGKVKGVKSGTATITCTSKATGLKATCEVTVGYVKLDQTEAIIQKGKTLTLTATVYPKSLDDKSVTWKSSDKSVATVTSKGKITGVKAGTATITCTSKATGLKATCKVTVSYVKLDQTEAFIQKGKTLTLKATVYPSKLEDKSVTWKSSNKDVATVSSSGKVKGVKAGTATITCTSKATGLKATCKVTVGYVKLDQTEVTVKKGKTVTLTATVYPSSLTDKTVTWESSDKSVATVTSAGKVKGIKAGTATITCTSNATGLSTTCKVKVTGTSSTRSLDGDDDDEVTGIENLDEAPAAIEPFDVYDLRGQKVRHQVKSLDGLPAGVYIVNGKKMLKK